MVVENKTSQPPAPADAKAAPPKKKDPKKEAQESELSEEDQELKEKLELCVQRLTEDVVGDGDGRATSVAIAPAAIRLIADEVRTATTSMTSVPKPLKFLRPHYAALCEAQEKLASGGSSAAKEASQELADVLSVLAITAGARGGREALKWRLAGKQVRERERVFLFFY